MAIECLDMALNAFGAPIYVYHEIVHNRFVVESFTKRGVVFVDDLEDVPEESHLLFSAHGVSPEIRKIAKDRQLVAIDATCPLVTKVHLEVVRHCKAGHEVVLIGHRGHPEVEGTMGQYRCLDGSDGGIYLVETAQDVATLPVKDPGHLAFVTQTTLSMDDTSRVIDALRERFPAIRGPRKDDICYATQNRQDAIRELAKECDVVLVVGSSNSSNSNRLRELAEQMGARAFLVDGAEFIQDDWLTGVQRVGVSAGASAPEVLVEGVLDRLRRMGCEVQGSTARLDEGVSFSLPLELRGSREPS